MDLKLEIQTLRTNFDAWKTKRRQEVPSEIAKVANLLKCAEDALEKAAEDNVWRFTAAKFLDEAKKIAGPYGIRV